jgi:hypothetical protein
MIAWPTEPLAARTIVASAVAMKRAFPRPHTARNPTIPPMLSMLPARADPAMMRTRPERRVRLAPILLDTHPVTSMATPMTSM